MNTLAARPSRGDLIDTATARRRHRRWLWTPLLALVIAAGGALAVLALGLSFVR